MKKRVFEIKKWGFIFLISLWIIAILYAVNDFRINGYAIYNGKVQGENLVLRKGITGNFVFSDFFEGVKKILGIQSGIQTDAGTFETGAEDSVLLSPETDACGNGILDSALGEQCDLGNNQNNNMSSSCNSFCESSVYRELSVGQSTIVNGYNIKVNGFPSDGLWDNDLFYSDYFSNITVRNPGGVNVTKYVNNHKVIIINSVLA